MKRPYSILPELYDVDNIEASAYLRPVRKAEMEGTAPTRFGVWNVQLKLHLWQPTSGMLRRVGLVWSEVSVERIASIFRATGTGVLGT
jgi:hypothetical protein